MQIELYPISAADLEHAAKGDSRVYPPLRFAILAQYLAAPFSQAEFAQLTLRLEQSVENWYREHRLRRE
jgi:hypothetical protein